MPDDYAGLKVDKLGDDADSLQWLRTLRDDPTVDTKDRLKAASELANYERPKLSAVDYRSVKVSVYKELSAEQLKEFLAAIESRRALAAAADLQGGPGKTGTGDPEGAQVPPIGAIQAVPQAVRVSPGRKGPSGKTVHGRQPAGQDGGGLDGSGDALNRKIPPVVARPKVR